MTARHRRHRSWLRIAAFSLCFFYLLTTSSNQIQTVAGQGDGSLGASGSEPEYIDPVPQPGGEWLPEEGEWGDETLGWSDDPALGVSGEELLSDIAPVELLDMDRTKPTVTIEKTARVLPGTNRNPGTAQSPVPVNTGDIIEYIITLDATEPGYAKNQYDVVFVLDWSGSMLSRYGDGRRASDAAKQTVLNVSKNIVDTYPGSRIALMGVNSDIKGKDAYNYTSLPTYLYLQYDTRFVGEEDYDDYIRDMFLLDGAYASDSNVAFMRAAIEKLKGATGTLYGTGLSNTSHRKRVVARDELDKGRIPVIILISDFQCKYVDYWTELDNRAQDFVTAFPEGILLVARADHSDNVGIWDIEVLNNVMDRFIKVGHDAGNPAWKWDKFLTGEDHDVLLWEMFQEQAPPPAKLVLEDMVPDGLTYQSSSPGGVHDPVQDIVTWTLEDLAVGQTEYTFQASVDAGGLFENHAQVTINDEPPLVSNKTYHTGQYALMLRQILLPRAGPALPQPDSGYVSAGVGSDSFNVRCESGMEGQPVAFTQCYLLSGGAGYRLEPVVPQYYEYAGYVATPTDTAHDSGSRKTGDILLDYTANNAYWVSIYLQPMNYTPGLYEWDARENPFGVIYPNPPT